MISISEERRKGLNVMAGLDVLAFLAALYHQFNTKHGVYWAWIFFSAMIVATLVYVMMSRDDSADLIRGLPPGEDDAPNAE